MDCGVDGISVRFTLWDTAGQEDYESLRPLACARAHVVVVGFSVDNPESRNGEQKAILTRCLVVWEKRTIGAGIRN